MYLNVLWVYLVIFSCQIVRISGWDNDELEIFDLVEEINKNFYNVLDIPQDADATTIRKAFRNLSLVLHPDKNDSPDADVQFRQLVAVYDVLKDPSKRERYDKVLENGLPNWRSAVYYYRHYRKMGLVEMVVILFVLVSIGQYLVGWASYLEKKFTIRQLLEPKLKKLNKKGKKQGESVVILENVIESIPAPSVADTLPVQIPKLVWRSVIGLPSAVIALREYWLERKRKKLEELLEEEEEKRRQEEDELNQKREKELRRRRKPAFVLPERSGEDGPSCFLDSCDEPLEPVKEKPPPIITGGFWTDDDLIELVRLVKKYPPGTTERWERIAEMMNRSVSEVTHMAAKMKDNCYRIPGQSEENEAVVDEQPKKVKTKGGKLSKTTGEADASVKDTSWSQTQQKALENALTKYQKGATTDRWEKIASSVPNKTKEECMLRYKYLVELVKKQKQEKIVKENSPDDCITQDTESSA